MADRVINFGMDEDTYQALSDLAERNGISMAAQLRVMIRAEHRRINGRTAALELAVERAADGHDD